jgi:fumarate reductase flavoprotein subunit
LADWHKGKEVTCDSCHGAGTPKSPPVQKACLNCHGGSYDAVAKSTSNLPINPHASHLGEVDCMQCHKGHQKSTLICDKCHDNLGLSTRN